MDLFSLLPDNKALKPATLPEALKFYTESFLFVRSTENVNAPGELVSEFFRETFYSSHYSPQREQGSRLDPDCPDLENEGNYTDGEKAVLEILRGKIKKDRGFSYTPAYPQLMRNSWLRKKHGRNIRGHFIGGAIAQALWNPDHRALVKRVENLGLALFSAGVGDKSLGNQPKSEILDAIMREVDVHPSDCFKDVKSVQQNLKDFILGSKPEEEFNNHQIYKIEGNLRERDIFPKQILNDFEALLSLEPYLPRIEWIFYLANYLRIAVPIWALSSVRSTSIVYDLLVNIIDNATMPTEGEFYSLFFNRNRKIFICSETPNSGGLVEIKYYANARIKLTLLLYLFDYVFSDTTHEYHLNISSTSAKEISLFDYFHRVLNSRDEIRGAIELSHNDSIDNYLIRQAEVYKGFRDPLNTSIFKNMAEMLRVLREPEIGFDSGGLLLPVKKGRELKGYIVSPQPALIRLFSFLAYNQRTNKRVVVQDLVDHFEMYGIDFSTSNEAREKLNKSLLQLGLLIGSPDAGANAAIGTPFHTK